MDLKNIHHPLKSSETGLAFSPDPSLLADQLIKFAEALKNKTTILTDVRLIQRASNDDFYMQTLIIRFAEPVTNP